MILYIDSTNNDFVELIAVTEKKIVSKQFRGNFLAENFAGIIKKFLQSQKLKFSDVQKIAVKTGPGFFSRVRTGVVAANALAFGLNRKVVAVRGSLDLKKVAKTPGQISVQAFYGAKPNISYSKVRP